ncbi:MAG: hypothetical protein H0U82_00030, partial [Actinobacteria bacterium]|nr:hypothetical protein [Actinomycetota bacterium]
MTAKKASMRAAVSPPKKRAARRSCTVIARRGAGLGSAGVGFDNRVSWHARVRPGGGEAQGEEEQPRNVRIMEGIDVKRHDEDHDENANSDPLQRIGWRTPPGDAESNEYNGREREAAENAAFDERRK